MAQTIKLKRSSVAGRAPTVNDLELGEVAINTYDGKMYIKKDVSGTESIVEISGGGTQQSAIWKEYSYTATSGQTTFSGADDNSATLTYVPNFIQVFLNGVLLDPAVDYTATSGTSIVLTSAASLNDLLQIATFVKVLGTGDQVTSEFTGDNSTTDFTLTANPGNEDNTIVFIDGVYQEKGTYSVTGTTLTFSTAPYTGASIEVIIASRNVSVEDVGTLTVERVQFDTTQTGSTATGEIAWNTDTDTLELGLNANVNLELGEQNYFQVKAAESISKGDVLYASGAVGTSSKVEVSKYIANNTIEEQRIIGLAAQDMALNDFGFAISFGTLRGLQTDGQNLTTPETWVLGDILYASAAVAGELTRTRPSAPNQAVPIAFVTSVNSSAGSLVVRAYELGSHLDEIHDVEVTSVADNDILQWNNSASRWENAAGTTSNIAEGTNLYWTSARGDSNFSTNLAASDTDNLSEGATNLYYTSARANADFDTRLATKSTTDLAEGTNLYYTDARVGSYLTTNSVVFGSTTTHQDAATFQSTATFQDELIVDVGTTAERPASPGTGSIRYNTTLELYEGYNGKEWAALSPTKTPDVYLIDNSVRFNDDDSAYLARTPASAGNRKTWTWAGWVKRGNLSGTYSYQMFAAATGNTDATYTALHFFNNSIRLQTYNVQYRTTSAVYRDTSAWMHVVCAVDTTQAIAANRIKLYVNGIEQTSFSASNDPALNADFYINSANEHRLGSIQQDNVYADGYMSNVYFIDGQALDPTSFGEFDDNGVWNPIAFTGTYGTNGFFLEFKTDSALGTDTSGNSNNWTPSGIVASDQMTDTPTVNYATLNSIDKDDNATLSEGNLKVASNGAGNSPATFFLTSGKWYWEAQGTGYAVGVAGEAGKNYTGSISGTGSKSIGHWSDDGRIYWDGGGSAAGATYTASDVVAVALDMDAGTVAFYKNNTLIYTATFGSGTVPDLSAGVFPVHNNGNTTSRTVVYNFGQRPFTYTPPTGFVALSSANLPTPAIADGKGHFQPVLYTGNGTTQSIGGLEFSPDFVWIKSRSSGSWWHSLFDAVRGAGLHLHTNNTNAEAGGGTSLLTSFDSSGFTLNVSPNGTVNNTGDTYVAWNWNAGGSTVTNTDGTITSQVRANTTAGFSIVNFALPASGNFSVGHGLSQAPDMYIVKRRGNTSGWGVWHTGLSGGTYYLLLGGTGAQVNDATIFSALPDASVLNIGSAWTSASSGINTIVYCFHSVDGFSKFGTYTGNGSTDGPFVYTGFRPAFVMLKSSSVGGSAGYDWIIHDTSRASYNASDKQLVANSSVEENKDSGGFVVNDRSIDILSNGFKLRAASAGRNQNGETFIYMAFAENPFKTARAR